MLAARILHFGTVQEWMAVGDSFPHVRPADSSSLDSVDVDNELVRHNFNERVFVVVPAQQHAASTALRKYLADHDADPMSALESRLRERFVAVRPRMLSDTERDAMKVELLAEPFEDAHFQIQSPYRHLCPGDEVLLHDDVVFASGRECSALVLELLCSSESLVTAISDNVVTLFVTLLRERGRQADYVDYLTKLCQFKATGIQAKQVALCGHLFPTTAATVAEVGILLDVHVTSNHQLTVCHPSTNEWTPIAQLVAADKGLARYFLATIRMLSAMCCSRNYIAIHAVEKQFPRDAVVAVVQDSRVHTKMRAAFCRLLAAVYVDRLPHEVLPRPKRVFVSPTVKMPPGTEASVPNPVSTDRNDADGFFPALKTVLNETLAACQGTLTASQSHLLLGMLPLCIQMLSFGCYTDESELKTLVQALVPLLRDHMQTKPIPITCADNFHVVADMRQRPGINSPALLTLVASDYPALVSTALDLLGSSFNVHRELRKHLEHVIVVPSDHAYSMYTNMRVSASVLRLYEETSETWLSMRAGETWKDVLSSLEWFIDVLATTDDLTQIQELVRGLGVDDLVVNITRSLGNFLVATPRTASNRVFLRRQEHLLDGCYRFFVLYTWQNTPAQTKLHDHVDFFKHCTFGTIEASPRPVLYQAKLLELLANLTLGANFVCEARLQGLIPLDSLLRALHRKGLPLPLKCKLVKVLHEGWLHTEQFVAEVAGSHTLVQFIACQPSIVRAMVQRASGGLSEAQSALKAFAKWLHVAPFYVAAIDRDKRVMLDAFMHTNTADPPRRTTISARLSVVRVHPTKKGSSAPPGIDAKYLVARLIAHANNSEIRLGQPAHHSTLEILTILEQVSSSNATQALVHLLGAPKMMVELGCRAHDEQFFALLSMGANVKWFDRVGKYLRAAIAAVDTRHPSEGQQDLDRNAGTTNLLEMLRLLCEGHHSKFQNLLRHQPCSHPSVNVVELVVVLFNELVRTLTPTSVPVLLKTFQAIVEFIQGPCEGNQLAVIDPSELHGGTFLDSINVLLSLSNAEPGFAPGDVHRLKYMQRDNYVVRLIKITLGQAHIPPADATPATSASPSAATSTTERADDTGFPGNPLLGALLSGPTSPPMQFMLNAGFNMYILFHRLLEVPAVAHILRSSLIPSDGDLRDLEESPLALMNPIVAAFNARRRLQRLSQLVKSDRDVSYVEAYAFFHRYCASVEVHVGGDKSGDVPVIPGNNLKSATTDGRPRRRLQRFYFPKPPVCAFLTSDMRNAVMDNINRDSPAEKIQDLFQRSDAIIAEMTHRYLMSFAGDKLFTWGKLLSFGFAIVLNMLLIACYVDMSLALAFQSPDDAYYHIGCVGAIGGVPITSIIRVFGLFQVIVSVGIVLLYAFTYDPSFNRHAGKAKKAVASTSASLLHEAGAPFRSPSSQSIAAVRVDRRAVLGATSPSATAYSLTIGGVHFENVRPANIGRSLVFLLLNPVYVYYVVYLSMAIMGFAGHNFFFAFHLFDILLRFPELTIIVHAVAWPWKSLVLSFCLMMIAIYIFAIVGFTYFRHQYPTVASSAANSTDTIAECGMLLSCYLTTFDQTFKNNGGIGSYMATQTPDDIMNWGPRLLFDNLFNIVILLIIVNIFFGIIIDTFGDQRSRMEARANDIAGKCFVCSLSRETFDRVAPVGFEHHIRNEHNLWNYVFLVAHLRFKSENEFDGVEQYLWRCIRCEDYSFVPLYHALALKHDASVKHDSA
ncbi:hypothetical protein DYB32_005561 [Aphanomyces invadans]|uniref:Ion transport domain-containing protein n=1 Tax=Aphanomyces invadans TaxID=157072 RepID=A0A3R7CZI5_9STRA|nr:hypothetical protein DYB32_005561 [Aphanomyces invadans]